MLPFYEAVLYFKVPKIYQVYLLTFQIFHICKGMVYVPKSMYACILQLISFFLSGKTHDCFHGCKCLHRLLKLSLSKTYKMSGKNKKEFGVWMDSRVAIVVGRQDVESGDFIIIGSVGSPGANTNPDEKTFHNQEIGLRLKFFKEVANLMQNIDEIHVTGTGQVQEQFIKFLAETPQYKNVVTSESTSNKMSDEKLIEFVTSHFN
jgi:hypothetical protein